MNVLFFKEWKEMSMNRTNIFCFALPVAYFPHLLQEAWGLDKGKRLNYLMSFLAQEF